MAFRGKYLNRLIELFKAYLRSGKSIEAFEEVRWDAYQLGKRLFREKVPLDWIVGLYVEALRSLESEAREGALDVSGCGTLLLEMVITYSTSLLRELELAERLRESEERFKRIADRSFDAIIAMDATGNITYASSAAKRIGGRGLRDFVGKRLHEFVHESHIPTLMQAFDEVMKGQSVDGLQIEMVREDGSSVTVEVNASPIVKDRKVVGVEGIFRDITERKRTEEALKRISREIQEAVHTQ